ncbi:hypothetical protein BX070DRAFT_66641 [Coemansia spiralis]|nr:hypothetical protein BX070DRAFT_66641 [Coemansia spiralis]
MDDFAFQLAADAAEAEKSSSNELSKSPTANEGKNGAEAADDSLPSFGSMFGFAASWGKRLQDELQLDQFVDQLKKQSEEVSKAYKEDIAEFAQAVKVGAARGVDELSTRFSQLKTDLETEFRDDSNNANSSKTALEEEGSRADGPTGADVAPGLLQGIGKHFQADAMKQRQERAKRLLGRLGADLEDLLRDAIVIEAPGSSSTEEQKTAARKIIYDRRMAQLAAIQESEDTYLVDPEASQAGDGAKEEAAAKEYAIFAKEFSLDGRKEEETAWLLEDNPAMAQLYKRLVPAKIAEVQFWTRYFFRAWLVDQEEIRRKKLVEAAVAATEEEQLGWDLDSDGEEPGKKGAANGASKASAGTPSAGNTDKREESASPPKSGDGSGKAGSEGGAGRTEPASKQQAGSSAEAADNKGASSAGGGEGKSKPNNSSRGDGDGDDDDWGEWE